MTFNSKLLKELMKESDYTQEKLKKEFDLRGSEITIDGIKNWNRTDNPRVPELEKIIILGEIFKVNPLDFLNDKKVNKYNSQQNVVNNVILLDKINLRASAGGGAYSDLPIETTKMAIDKSAIALEKGLDPKNLKVIEVIGDSMEPEYYESDFAVVDMVNGRYDFTKIGGVYVVRVADMIYIKKVEFLPENKIKLISLNKQYGDMYPHKDGYEYEILGKVCGKIHFSKGLFFDRQGIE
ncbi:MAG: transcriptional regulator [Campylobacteraceae bacterium]|jgi:phage repressor protein C with HTH and peptisase S24 domain|nr:transcriptional regulator [Campylobacteraceae bacterium]